MTTPIRRSTKFFKFIGNFPDFWNILMFLILFLFFTFTYCSCFPQRQKDLLEIFFFVFLSEICESLITLVIILEDTKKPQRAIASYFLLAFYALQPIVTFFWHQEIFLALDCNPPVTWYMHSVRSLFPSSHPPPPIPAFIVLLHSSQWMSDMSQLLAILCYFQTGLRKALNTSQISVLSLLYTNPYTCWRYISLILSLRVY